MRRSQPARPQYLWKSGWWPREGEGAWDSRFTVFMWIMCRGEPSEGIMRARMWRPIARRGDKIVDYAVKRKRLVEGEGDRNLRSRRLYLLQSPVPSVVFEVRGHCYG